MKNSGSKITFERLKVLIDSEICMDNITYRDRSIEDVTKIEIFKVLQDLFNGADSDFGWPEKEIMQDRNLHGGMKDKIKEDKNCWDSEIDYKAKYERLVKEITRYATIEIAFHGNEFYRVLSHGGTKQLQDCCLKIVDRLSKILRIIEDANTPNPQNNAPEV